MPIESDLWEFGVMLKGYSSSAEGREMVQSDGGRSGGLDKEVG